MHTSRLIHFILKVVSTILLFYITGSVCSTLFRLHA